MLVEHLELVDFRNYRQATFDLTAGTTCVVGQNGQGKTNLAEALAYLSGLTSFRQAPLDALIRVGADQAIIRAQIVDADGSHTAQHFFRRFQFVRLGQDFFIAFHLAIFDLYCRLDYIILHYWASMTS